MIDVLLVLLVVLVLLLPLQRGQLQINGTRTLAEKPTVGVCDEHTVWHVKAVER